jgi:hypothetical protein
MKLTLLATALVVSLSGCVSTQVIKATGLSDKTLCIVDNPAVRVDFRDAYERQVQAKGYQTKIVPTNAACPTTSTYQASYGFHWGMYLASAQLTVYSNGKEVGKAIYKAPYADPAKHGRVEGKIETLVAQLLP